MAASRLASLWISGPVCCAALADWPMPPCRDLSKPSTNSRARRLQRLAAGANWGAFHPRRKIRFHQVSPHIVRSASPRQDELESYHINASFGNLYGICILLCRS